MKVLTPLLLALLLAGCEYTVSLCPEPKIDVDPAWVGLWQSKPEGNETLHLLLLPLGTKEYLVSYPAGKEDAMYARACRTESGGLSLLQLTWFGTAKGSVPDDAKIYQYASAQLKEGALIVRMLNIDVAGKEAKTPEELTAAIAAARDNPKLFDEEMVFTKVPQ